MAGIDGMNQGGEGIAQGGIGSFVGKATGSLTGMNRAATGGPGMHQSLSQPTAASPISPGGAGTPQNSTRKPQSFLGFLGGLLPVAASFIPGIGPIASKAMTGIGSLLGGISQQNQQNAAAGAAQASTGAQNAIAGQRAGGPNLGQQTRRPRAGITSAVDNSNAANPGRLMMDLFGGAISNAIAGDASQRNAGLSNAAGIYQGTGATAQQAATAGGNPWQPLAKLAPTPTPNKGAQTPHKQRPTQPHP